MRGGLHLYDCGLSVLHFEVMIRCNGDERVEVMCLMGGDGVESNDANLKC